MTTLLTAITGYEDEKKATKACASGPLGSTSSRKSTLLFPSMSSTYTRPVRSSIHCHILIYHFSLHWYLAIICNPEYTLLRPPPPPVSPPKSLRKRKRIIEDSPELGEVEPPSLRRHLIEVPELVSNPIPPSISAVRPASPNVIPDSEEEFEPTQPVFVQRGKDETKEEKEVESMIRSCSIHDSQDVFTSGMPGAMPPETSSTGYKAFSPDRGEMSFGSPMDTDGMELRYPSSPTHPDPIVPPSVSTDRKRGFRSSSPINVDEDSSSPTVEQQMAKHRSGIPPSVFYQSVVAREKGKQRAIEVEEPEKEKEKEKEPDPPPPQNEEPTITAEDGDESTESAVASDPNAQMCVLCWSVLLHELTPP